VLNDKAAIGVDLAMRLESWLDRPSAESWLNGQIAFDLWQAEQHRPKVNVRHVMALV
jgi:plasmid maintenance system antidote protein VapI